MLSNLNQGSDRFTFCIVFLSVFASLLRCTPDHESEQIAIPQNYTNLCATCHGEDLKGELAQSLIDGSWQFGARDSDLFRSIKFGHPQFGMPSWGAVLDDQQIKELVTFIRSREDKSGAGRPPLPQTLETLDYQIKVETLTEDVETPWGIAFPDKNTTLVTERPGRLRIIENGVLLPDPVEGTPQVLAEGQGGLLDVVLDPDYSNNGWVYLSFSHPIIDAHQDTLTFTSAVRGKINQGKWQQEEVIYQADSTHYTKARIHYGGRLAFDHQGYLYLTIGDRSVSEQAQELGRPNGKVHRLNSDGTIPDSNPFIGDPEALPSIYSYGHRNPQGLTTHPGTGQIWEAEHGPLGGDELNLIKPGLNYGWPSITHGINYNGEPISEFAKLEGMEQPVLYWKPSIAVCGVSYYQGDQFPKWSNQLLVGALRFEEVKLLDVEKDRVIFQHALLKNAGRVRIARSGPDGSIYVLLNRPDKVLRLSKI